MTVCPLAIHVAVAVRDAPLSVRDDLASVLATNSYLIWNNEIAKIFQFTSVIHKR